MYSYNGQVGVDNAAQTQCVEFSPNGRIKNEIKNDGWWLMKILWTHVQRELIDQSKNEKWGAWCSVAIEINKDK